MAIIIKLMKEITDISKQMYATRDETKKVELRKQYRTKYHQLKIQRLIVAG